MTRLKLAWPAARLAWRYLDDGDAWRSLDYHAPMALFGEGSVREFEWYFEGDSSVAVKSVDDICKWLSTCEYVRDIDLFQLDDYWQHPRTFEQLRHGDCEDHALWAWRKLVELGYPTVFVSGRRRRADGTLGGHAWVQWGQGAEVQILEAVGRNAGAMVRSLESARDDFEPHVGVDHGFRRRFYAGYVRMLQELREQRLARRRAKDGEPPTSGPAAA